MTKNQDDMNAHYFVRSGCEYYASARFGMHAQQSYICGKSMVLPHERMVASIGNTDNLTANLIALAACRAAAAWQAALAKNTVESYTKFIDFWPYDTFLVSAAKQKIKEAKTPAYLRWFVSHLFWILWVAALLIFVGAVTVFRGVR